MAKPVSVCSEPENGEGHCTTTLSVPGQGEDGGEAVPVVDFAALAEQARAELTVPDPVIGSAPPTEGTLVVAFPVWLWIQAEAWEPRTAEASTGGESVQVTATPAEVVWEMGDGASVRCAGAGTPFNAAVHVAGDPSPDCGHTYRSSSKNRGGADTVTARWSWDVEWSSSSGEGGEMGPLETSASVEVEVVEVHSLVTQG
ncbi:hypothetical protein [Nocardiopsis composta]|uniref:ATP/GTP-binding protein n=1 Tax=Nocardiopsis composta TaxID=157465 RepID=A0A7W8VGI8_9ACTN|nr:hypothetical protein [Nocardiopsis composta]MBB5435203.1 hypothetical protein [Nocardiopsis composta]